MQRLRAQSQVRLCDKDLLPSLKATNASYMGRTIVPISKFDLDSNMVLKQQKRLKMINKDQLSQVRSKQKNKIKKNIIVNFLPLDHVYKLITSDSRRQLSSDNFDDILQRNTYKNLVNLQLSKTSSKSYGFIKGYAANSHPGPYSLINEDRICIVTNLNKMNIRSKQISFFSIYDGSNGLLKTDYFRDNFHQILNSHQQLLTDPETAIKSTIQKIQKTLSSQTTYIQDPSKVGYSILISIGQIGYVVVCGPCRVVISKNYGEEVEKVSIASQNKTVSKIEITTRRFFMKKEEALNVTVKKVYLQQNLDFILVGSEGLFETFKQDELCKKIWANILNTNYQNIHSCLGQASLTLLNSVFGHSSTKNASLILLGFANIQNCFKNNLQKLNLPFIQQSRQKV